MNRPKIMQGINDGTGLKLFNPHINYFDKLSQQVPETATYHVKQAWYFIDQANKVSRLSNMRPEEVERLLRNARSWAYSSMRHIEAEEIRLSKYWS